MHKEKAVLASVPDYQRQFSKRNVKNYLASFLGPFCGQSFAAMLFSSYLVFVYSEYLGIGAGLISLVVSVGIVVDGVSDFCMGLVMDRVISKWGKARHWLFISAIPVGVTMALMWMVPAAASKTLKVVWAFVFYNLFCTFLTTVNLPAQSLPALVSDNPKVQENMSFAYNVTAAFVSSVLGWLVSAITGSMGENLGAYRVIAAIAALITTTSLLLMAALLKEQRGKDEWTQLKKDYRLQHRQEKNESVWQQVKNLLHNGYWVLYLVINLLTMSSLSFMFGTMAYWLEYILGDMSKITIFMTAINVPCLIGTFLYFPASKVMSTRTLAITTTFAQLGFSIVMWITGAEHFTLFLIATGIKFFIMGIQTPVALVMIPKLVDYGEWKTGSRQEGMCNAGTAVAGKILSAVATALCGAVLAASGYVGGSITDGAAASINFLFLGVPCITVAIAGILWLFFKLDDKKLEQYRREVKERNAALERIETPTDDSEF